jgi:hypothetical protein
MSTSPGVVTAVRWTEICPWLLLVRAARTALFVRVIVLATAGVWLTQWGWSVIEGPLLPEEGAAPLVRLTDVPPPSLIATLPATASVDWPGSLVDRHTWSGPLIRGWGWVMQPLMRLTAAEGWRAGFALLFAAAWAVAVWALIGGAIARIAAVYLARGELLGAAAALRTAAAGWLSSIAAPAFCLGVIALFAALLMVVGLVSRLGFFTFLFGLFWPVPLLVGAAIAAGVIGLAVGWPFVWSSIAAERTDAFDGVSRGYAFAYQRPLHLVFFVLVATVLGLLAQTAVTLLVDATLDATEWSVGRGANPAFADALLHRTELPDGRDLGNLEAAGGKLMRFWSAGVLSLAQAFPLAYLFPAAMGAYLLLRRLIDSTELGEVAMDDEDMEPALPPLSTDPATGVPTMPPAAPAGVTDGATAPAG